MLPLYYIADTSFIGVCFSRTYAFFESRAFFSDGIFAHNRLTLASEGDPGQGLRVVYFRAAFWIDGQAFRVFAPCVDNCVYGFPGGYDFLAGRE